MASKTAMNSQETFARETPGDSALVFRCDLNWLMNSRRLETMQTKLAGYRERSHWSMGDGAKASTLWRIFREGYRAGEYWDINCILVSFKSRVEI